MWSSAQLQLKAVISAVRYTVSLTGSTLETRINLRPSCHTLGVPSEATALLFETPENAVENVVEEWTRGRKVPTCRRCKILFLWYITYQTVRLDKGKDDTESEQNLLAYMPGDDGRFELSSIDKS